MNQPCAHCFCQRVAVPNGFGTALTPPCSVLHVRRCPGCTALVYIMNVVRTNFVASNLEQKGWITND